MSLRQMKKKEHWIITGYDAACSCVLEQLSRQQADEKDLLFLFLGASIPVGFEDYVFGSEALV